MDRFFPSSCFWRFGGAAFGGAHPAALTLASFAKQAFAGGGGIANGSWRFIWFQSALFLHRRPLFGRKSLRPRKLLQVDPVLRGGSERAGKSSASGRKQEA